MLTLLPRKYGVGSASCTSQARLALSAPAAILLIGQEMLRGHSPAGLGLYRERDIQRARAKERDPAAPLQ